LRFFAAPLQLSLSSWRKFDGNNFNSNLWSSCIIFRSKGYGITPILLSSSIDFMRAEAALFGGTGTAKFI
jgi:hypothetical protein